jgi:hypothetical protein
MMMNARNFDRASGLDTGALFENDSAVASIAVVDDPSSAAGTPLVSPAARSNRSAKLPAETYLSGSMSDRALEKPSSRGRKAVWFLAVLAAAGCSTTTAAIHAPRPTPAATQEEWRRYQSSGNMPPDDAVVHVISRGVGCSGTLISNNLVLTAHHCMVERDPEGEIIDQDLPANELEVEVDGDNSPPAMVQVVAAVAPPCGWRGGNGDIAVLVLSRRVVGRSTMPVRLADPPRAGEPIEPLGFGHCALSSDREHHVRHAGGNIEELGTFALSAPAAICPGDSGGPAQSSLTGEAVGVVSAGVMDDSDQTRDEATFTRLDVWRPLFAKAELIAEGSSAAEVPPIAGCDAE